MAPLRSKKVRGPNQERESGVALIVVVSVIALLMALTVQLNKDMRHELVSSTNLMNYSKLSVITKSGYNLAEALLLADIKDNSFDSEQEGWAKLNNEDLSSLLDSGKLEVGIRELSGRFQLNSLVAKDQAGVFQIVPKNKEILERLLSNLDPELGAEEIDIIVSAIADWIDEDDNGLGVAETESSYYLSLTPSYTCKNSQIEFLEELLLIRGISKKLYYGNDGSPGLKDLVTAHGNDGKININFAPTPLLLALNDDMSEELTEKMTEYRQDEENKDDLQNVNWYTNIGSWPSHIVLDPDIITVASSYFEIVSVGMLNEMSRTLRSVVRRDARDKIVMISRKVE